MHKQSFDSMTLKTLEHFLSAFMHNMMQVGSPEGAFVLSVINSTIPLPTLFQQMADEIQVEGKTIDEVLNALEQYYHGTEIGRVLSALRRILEHSVKDSINQIQRVLFQIQRHRILLNKRNNIQKAVRFKARILLNLTSFLVGFIAALSPFFSILSGLSVSNFSSILLSQLTTPPPLLAILLPLVALSYVSIRTEQRISEQHTLVLLLLSGGLFCMGFFLGCYLFSMSVPVY